LNKLNAGVLHKYLSTEKQDRHIKKKLVVWDSSVQKADTEIFSTLNDLLTRVDVIAKKLLNIIC